MASIQLAGVGKHWGDTTALEGITLDIASGSFCVLLGPSGCGKSTTLRIIAGLETASTGTVSIGGRDVTNLPPSQRNIAMVFQNYALFPHLSVAGNITFGLSVRKVDKEEAAKRLKEAAELLGLSRLLERKPSQLSGGQQQRVALGRALVAQAQVCLMDEPLSNLDAQLRQEMRAELRQLQQRLGLTVVYVTHDQAEAMSMADQVVLLNKGRIEQAATPREMYARPATTFAAAFIGTPAMNLLRVQAQRIAGSEVPAGREAHWLGVRPEDVTLGGAVPGIVRSVEYLGADLIAHCAVGSETLTVRTAGQADLAAGSEVRLQWPAARAHHFDSQGRRLA
ncbi:ABC transporter ATP-binding protein [Ramlibacter humi]|uniref:ABC transporter ATP-binding protein n=1 Tax=Ramlibacter humi TaxID=2530451 RepID=A0A4Z0CBE1_9BURK|nr:ABC transporter ATP-binding protein [Ramlibacter humi]TFZ07680.1 ABC transporter ATP-binding protein [Ramlibacter humi]